MKPKFALSHDFLSVHHEYFVGTFASILLCPPHFQMSGYATVSVDTLSAPTHHINVINQISYKNMKFLQERDKELKVIQRDMLNATGPLCAQPS